MNSNKHSINSNTTLSSQAFHKTAIQISTLSMIMNIVLSFIKLLAGILSHSSAMISDAIHSATDVFSVFIVMIGIIFSNKQADEQYPYGYERFECIASIIVSILLLLTGIKIGNNGLQLILSGDYIELQAPGLLALVVAIISIVIKEGMYQFTRHTAKKIHSSALMADAWHHRSDAFASVGTLIGILGARMGLMILDCIASLIICFFIVKAALDIFIDATNKMTDHSCNEDTINQMKSVIGTQEGVLSIDTIRTRLFGSKIYVDIEVAADGGLSLIESHLIAECIHDKIEANFPDVKRCMVYINPAK